MEYILQHESVFGGEYTMSEKPIHYDGSIQNSESSNDEGTVNEQFQLTDEMRLNISGNPYMFEK